MKFRALFLLASLMMVPGLSLAEDKVSAEGTAGVAGTDQGVAGTAGVSLNLRPIRSVLNLDSAFSERLLRLRGALSAPSLEMTEVLTGSINNSVHRISLDYSTAKLEGQVSLLPNPQGKDVVNTFDASLSTGPMVVYVAKGGERVGWGEVMAWVIAANLRAKASAGLTKLGEGESVKAFFGPKIEAAVSHQMIFSTVADGIGYEVFGEGGHQFNFLASSNLESIDTGKAQILFVIKPRKGLSLKAGPQGAITRYKFKQPVGEGSMGLADINAYELGGIVTVSAD